MYSTMFQENIFDCFIIPYINLLQVNTCIVGCPILVKSLNLVPYIMVFISYDNYSDTSTKIDYNSP